MKQNFEVLDGYILVEPLYPESAIIISDTVERPFKKGRIIQVGGDVQVIQVGDIALFGKNINAAKHGKRMDNLYIIKHDKVIAIE